MKIEIPIPAGAANIIQKLAAHGFDAYVVGGCVRDCLMGRVAEDWDITTNAKPPEIKSIFAKHKLIDIGERHGTISISAGGQYYEVTTYRIDGAYGDGRRPDTVSFTASLREDLCRRDFTINAMAYNHTAGLVDYFGGLSDIKSRTIRCVGNATARFAEDYLRIMRAYRFAATLGFDLADDARAAAINGRANLHSIAVERVRTEFMKMLLSNDFDRIELFFDDCGHALFPEIAALRGFAQNNPFHCHDAYGHTMAVLRATPADAAQRLAALYHDTGKLHTRTTDNSGIHHYYKHEAASVDIAAASLAHWRFDNHTTDRVLTIIKHHGGDYNPKRTNIKRLLNKLGEDNARAVLNFQLADTAGKSDKAKAEKLPPIIAAKAMLEEIIAVGEPVKISDLVISGRDVMSILNINPSPAIGEHLAYLIEQVIEDPAVNNYDDLVKLLKLRHNPE